MSKLMHCYLCGENQKDYYIYKHVLNEGYEVIYCKTCADKASCKVCYVCGHFIGRNQSRCFTFSKGYICEICIPHCQSIIEGKSVPPVSFAIGIYCGYCHVKTAMYKYPTPIYESPIQVAAHLYYYATEGICDRSNYKTKFKRIDKKHRWDLNCRKNICSFKKCKNSGWPERFNRCIKHMPDKEFKHKVVDIISNSANLCKDASEIIFNYIYTM